MTRIRNDATTTTMTAAASAPQQTITATTTTLRRTGVSYTTASTFGKIVPTIRCQPTTRATGRAAAARTIADDTDNIIKIVKISVEGVTGTATDLAIVLTVMAGEDTRILAKAIAEKSPAMRHGAVLIPSVLFLFDLKMRRIPSADTPDGLGVPASVPDALEGRALVLKVPVSAHGPHAILAQEVPAWIPRSPYRVKLFDTVLVQLRIARIRIVLN